MRRQVSAVALLIVAWVGSAVGQPVKRAITHEDVWLMRRVGAPALSPDGTWVVVSVTEPAYDEKDQVSDLWLVPADGSASPRRVTHTKTAESGVVWSRDSRRIAFSARRDSDEVAQIYVLDLARGGESQRVTSAVTGARAPVWRPDGNAILFTSDVYPGAKSDADNRTADAERKARKWTARVYETFPVRMWDRWLDERRPSLFAQALGADGPARDLLAGTELVARPGFGGQLRNSGDELDAAWTPDGEGVVFAATVSRHEAAYADVALALWVVPAAGGEPKRLTDAAGSYGAPAFRPDGRALLATFEPETAHVYNADRLVSWAWPGMTERREVTSGFDRSVGAFDVAPDSRTVYFLAEDAGHERLYRVPAAGGTVTEVGSLDAGVLTGLAVAGGARGPMLVAAWQSAIRPPEVVSLDPTSGARRVLTSFNAERAAPLDVQPLLSFWFTTSAGKRMHNLVALPPGFDESGRYPLLVIIHGGPHSMWRDEFVIRWNYHLLAAPGYVVLLTNYTGSTGFGEAFAQGIQGDPLEGPANELNQAADEAIRRFPFIDGSRQAAGGASYGGHLANWLAVTTTRYRTLVSHAGLFDLKSQWATSDTIYGRERTMGGPPWEGRPLWRDQSPFYRASNLKTPILVTVGERDFRVPLNNALEFWSVLQRMRIPSRLVVFPDENHWVLKGENSRFFYREVHTWLARHLGTEASSGGR
jgi:dipeptidyl aminopeptidase/acylaminoacyl peptidase